MDDSRVIRNILSKILMRRGFETVRAGNGLEALQVMKREGSSISMILADWDMLEMHGLEFVKALCAQREFAQISVMMVTSETESHQMAEALIAGANVYIMKPFSPEIVTAKLQLLHLDGGGIDPKPSHSEEPCKPFD
jgi:two-component system chemotaxis response regulator CheY